MDVYAIDLVHLDKCVCVYVCDFEVLVNEFVDSLVSKAEFFVQKTLHSKRMIHEFSVRLMNSNGGEIDKCKKICGICDLL